LSAEIKGLSLKNAFNNTAAFTLLDARKICAVKRIIRLIFASSAEIMRKPSDCWSCHAIAVPNQRWFRDRRIHLLSAETSNDQSGTATDTF